MACNKSSNMPPPFPSKKLLNISPTCSATRPKSSSSFRHSTHDEAIQKHHRHQETHPRPRPRTLPHRPPKTQHKTLKLTASQSPVEVPRRRKQISIPRPLDKSPRLRLGQELSTARRTRKMNTSQHDQALRHPHTPPVVPANHHPPRLPHLLRPRPRSLLPPR